VAHPYPPDLSSFAYVGKHLYFLTFTTERRQELLVRDEIVAMVLAQILRAANKHAMRMIAYCFMPDHVHMLIEALTDESDCRVFIKTAKQYSGYHFAQRYDGKLWQRYGYERVLRKEIERATTIRYILDNPVQAGLSRTPADYPFLGSQCYTVAELIQQATRSEDPSA
jgi:putative transposase